MGSKGQVPPLALIPAGQLLADAEIHSEGALAATSPLVNEALTTEVRKQHRRRLHQLRDFLLIHPTALAMSLVEVAIAQLHAEAQAANWQWQTLHRSMCSLTGALSNVSLYTTLLHPILLGLHPAWRAALSTASQRAQHSQPRGQAAATSSEMATAVEQEPRLWCRVALILMWVASPRVGCTLQLRVQDVSLRPDGLLALHFAQGKGVRLRGPYTVGASVCGDWKAQLEAYLEQRLQAGRPSDLLFPATEDTALPRRTSRCLAAVRVADRRLNLRAVRRGSIQAASASGVETEAIRDRAGHTSIRTTRRYMDWGMQDHEALQQGAEISRAIAPATPAPQL